MNQSNDVETLPVMQVVELDWIIVYNQAIAERNWSLAERLIQFFLPRQ